MTWDEEDLRVHPALTPMAVHLRELVEPAREVSQLVHGDLSGNVLFAPGMPPAIIDFSPYWRPAAFAEAIVVADGLLWFGQNPGLLARADRAGARALLARAVLFRLLDYSEQLLNRQSMPLADGVDLARYPLAVEMLEGIAR